MSSDVSNVPEIWSSRSGIGASVRVSIKNLSLGFCRILEKIEKADDAKGGDNPVGKLSHVVRVMTDCRY